MKQALGMLLVVMFLTSLGVVPAFHEKHVEAQTEPALWAKTYGGSGDDHASAVAIAPNGDIIVTGHTFSFGAGEWDVWVLHLDKNGNVKWQKTYGGNGSDWGFGVAIADNGDIIVVGVYNSIWNSSERSWSGGDFWILRLDEHGNVKWQKTHSDEEWAAAFAVAIAPNGDIIVAGGTDSFGTRGDFWILRLDEHGNVKWQKTYGGTGFDYATGVAIAPNGDIIVAGHTESFGAGDRNVWVLRLDANGKVKGQKTYGGWLRDYAEAVAIAPNGDIIVAGETESFGAGKKDAWVLRLDENGDVKWQKTYGGSRNDWAEAVAITPNGDIIVTGTDLLRLSPDGELKWAVKQCGDDIKVLPDGTAVLAASYNDNFLVVRFNVDEVPDYSSWYGWNKASLEVYESNAVVQTTNAVVGTSNAEIHDTNAEVHETNAEIRTEWSISNNESKSHIVAQALSALNSLKAGLESSKKIVIENIPEEEVTLIGCALDFIPLGKYIPIKNEILKFGASVITKKVIEHEIEENIKKEIVKIEFNDSQYKNVIFKLDQIQWELNSLDDEQLNEYNNTFVRDMKNYYGFISEEGKNFPTLLKELQEAYEESKIKQDILITSGELLLIPVSGPLAHVISAGAKCIVNFKNTGDFLSVLSATFNNQTYISLSYSEDILYSIQYLKNASKANQKEFPSIKAYNGGYLLEVSGNEIVNSSGSLWTPWGQVRLPENTRSITVENTYTKPLKIRVIIELEWILEPYQETTEIEKSKKFVETWESVINPNDKKTFEVNALPDPITEWIDKASYFGYSIKELSHFYILYGEQRYQAMKEFRSMSYIEKEQPPVLVPRGHRNNIMAPLIIL